MSNEIKVIASLTFTKTGIDAVNRVQTTAGGDLLTQKTSGTLYVNRVQNIGSSAEVIGVGDLTMPGWTWMKNLSAVGGESIHIRNGAAGANVIELEPLEYALFRFESSGTMYAISAAGGADLEYFIIED